MGGGKGSRITQGKAGGPKSRGGRMKEGGATKTKLRRTSLDGFPRRNIIRLPHKGSTMLKKRERAQKTKKKSKQNKCRSRPYGRETSNVEGKRQASARNVGKREGRKKRGGYATKVLTEGQKLVEQKKKSGKMLLRGEQNQGLSTGESHPAAKNGNKKVKKFNQNSPNQGVDCNGEKK